MNAPAPDAEVHIASFVVQHRETAADALAAMIREHADLDLALASGTRSVVICESADRHAVMARVDQLQAVQWLSRVPASTSVVDLRSGQPGALAKLALAFGPALQVMHKGKPALQSQAEAPVRLRAGAPDAPALRCVVTRIADARSGKLLWKASLGGQVNAGAMTYEAGGRQYVAIAAGSALFAFALPAR